MNAQEKDIHDLLSDSSFRAWVLNDTPELDDYWKNWLMEHPDRVEAFERAKIIVKALRFDEKSLTRKDKMKLWRRIEATNHLQNKSNGETKIKPINEQNQYPSRNAPGKQINYLLRYAAVLAGVFILAVAATYILKGLNGNVEVQLVKKVNGAGQKSTIFLPDGSQVNLNASSLLTYPKYFSGDKRKVFLKGEAFFKVKKGEKPFVVETEHLEARVLGTSFNIRALDEKEEYSLSLLTGKVMVVSLDSPQDYLVLNPGQKSSLDSESGNLIATAFDYDEEMAWKDGVIVFKKLSINKVLERLEAWYGVEFILEDGLAESFFVTGKFDNESLENVLRSISYTGNFSYSFQGKKVYIKFDKKP